jgi:hypothetical protein
MAPQQPYILITDVAAIFSKMNGYSIGTCLFYS